ncbi:hypothetical protein H9P43_008995 [Blastocladiella emersonii ATCC 22665]|nr:hypothetical protein H9P43_008995 [Blastocladiella emersonii ATCC 22665]
MKKPKHSSLNLLPPRVLNTVLALSTTRTRAATSSRCLATAARSPLARCTWTLRTLASYSPDSLDTRFADATDAGFPAARQLRVPFAAYLRSRFAAGLSDGCDVFKGGKGIKFPHPFGDEDVVAAFYRGGGAGVDAVADGVAQMRVGSGGGKKQAPARRPAGSKSARNAKRRPAAKPQPATLATGGTSTLFESLRPLLDAPPASLHASLGLRAAPEGMMLPYFFLYANDLAGLRWSLAHLYRLDPGLRTARAPLTTWSRLWLTTSQRVRGALAEAADRLAPEHAMTYGAALAVAALVLWNVPAFDAVLAVAGIEPLEFAKLASASPIYTLFLSRIDMLHRDAAAVVPPLLRRLTALGWTLDRARDPSLAFFVTAPHLAVSVFVPLATEYDVPLAKKYGSPTHKKVITRLIHFVSHGELGAIPAIAAAGVMEEESWSYVFPASVAAGQLGIVEIMRKALNAEQIKMSTALKPHVDRRLRALAPGACNTAADRAHLVNDACLFAEDPKLTTTHPGLAIVITAVLTTAPSPLPPNLAAALRDKPARQLAAARLVLLDALADDGTDATRAADAASALDTLLATFPGLLETAQHTVRAAAQSQAVVQLVTRLLSRGSLCDLTPAVTHALLPVLLTHAPGFVLDRAIAWHAGIPMWAWKLLAPVLAARRWDMPKGAVEAAREAGAVCRKKGDFEAAGVVERIVRMAARVVPGSMDDMSVD